MAVAHTAARATAERQVGSITASLGDIEMQYLSLEKELTPQHAQELGFVKPQVVAIVYATAPRTLTINSNR